MQASIFFFFFNDTATTEIYTLSLHDALPIYLGVYEGAMGYESVRKQVESSDCLILIGALMTDINFGISPTPIEQSRSIYVTRDRKSTRLNSSHANISYAVFCLKKKKNITENL